MALTWANTMARGTVGHDTSGRENSFIWHVSGTKLEPRVARRTSKRTFGSMRRLPSGRYQARYVGPTGVTVTAPATFTARIDAEAWLAAERRQVEEPESWQSPKLRLEEARRVAEVNRLPILRDYAEQWIDQRRNSKGEPLRPLTRDKYRSSLRAHVYPNLGDLPLDEITRTVVRSWYHKLDIGPTARAHAYSTLRTILNTAVLDDELLARNPAYIRGAGVSGHRKNLRPASLDELAAMVDAMPEQRRLLLLLATWCALRSGELRELAVPTSSSVVTRMATPSGGCTSGERSCWRVPGRRSAGAVPPHWSGRRRPMRA